MKRGGQQNSREESGARVEVFIVVVVGQAVVGATRIPGYIRILGGGCGM